MSTDVLATEADATMRELAAQIAHEADALGAQLAEFVLEEVPAYRGLDRDEVREVTVVSGRVNVGAIFSMLQFGIPPETIRQPAGAVDFAHTMIHRGIDLATILRTYRLGHDRLWDTWIAFIAQRIDDPALLAAVTRRSSALMFGYFDAVGQDIAADYDVERERWLRSAAAVRDAAVEQLLDGTITDAEQAGLRLRHELRRHHVAFIVWSADAQQGAALAGQAELAAGAVAAALEAGPPLVVRPGAGALWGWASRFDAGPADLEERLADLGGAGLLVAVGSPGWGLEGFRESHAQAREAQRVARLAASPARVTTYPAIALASALCADVDVARRFSRAELGALDAPTPSAARLRETLTAYFEEGNSPVRAARRLGVHEKTVVYRVRKAEEVLGHAVGGRRAELELALRVRLLLSEPT